MTNGNEPAFLSTSAPTTVSAQTIRDLMGLLALPALWAGRDAETVLRITVEASERMVPLAFTFVQARLHTEKPPINLLRVEGQYIEDEKAKLWQGLIDNWNSAPTPDGRAVEIETPLGVLQVFRLSMGFGTFGGKIWFGSSDPSFPSFTQSAFLRAATSLATTGLQAARANSDREQASRAKDEFLAMLGHELRNPLAPITTALELLKLRSSEGFPRELQVIERQARHLSRLVDDLLDVTRITRGKVELRREPLDLKQVLARALEDTQQLFEQQRHSLILDLPGQPIWVFGDAVRLTQVFSNLLTNAGKYTDPGGRIEVTVATSGTQSSIVIRDNGHGISSALLPRLFTIFEQGNTTIDRGKGGLGIGLALVKNFVELHGGSVTASSEGVGQGAEFTVKLPLFENEDRPQEAFNLQPLASAPFKCRRILLVDDNVDALTEVTQYLKQRGHNVQSTSDPVEALRIAPSFLPEVAVLDIGLPVLDGYALAKELRKQGNLQKMPLIALTGYGQPKDVEKSWQSGFNAHLVKPVLLSDLDRAIADVMAKV